MEKLNAVKESKKSQNNKAPKKVHLPIMKKKEFSDNEETLHRFKAGFDRPFFIIVVILLCIGTTFVFSSSYVYAQSKFNDSYLFARKQIFWALFSMCAMIVVSHIDYRNYKRFATPLFVISYVLLVAVFFFGADANGARRWIDLGFMNFQPSEIVKLTIIILSSKYIVKLTLTDIDGMRSVKHGIMPFAVLFIIIAIPLYFQPHLSAMIIIAALIFSIMYLGGARKRILFGSIGIAGTLLGLFVWFTEHGRSRITNWLHPELDIKGKGWQPLQSLYAIGSGGLWGVGIGQSKQKHLYLPEPQNDYIFSIICEEMGFVFAVVVIILFILLIWRGFYIAKEAPSKFSSLLVMGIIIQIGLQVFLNIAVVTNTIPCTGVSLPFFSYGGTSLTIFMAEMGIVLNVSRYSYSEKN